MFFFETMEFMAAMSKSGCRNMSFGVSSASTSPIKLNLHAGWVKTGNNGAAGELEYNGTKLVWDTVDRVWIINGQRFDGNGQCIEIPGSTLETIRATGIVRFGKNCIVKN